MSLPLKSKALSSPGVVLLNPKYQENVAGAIRACAAWGIPFLRWTGYRVNPEANRSRIPREMRMYKEVDFALDPSYGFSPDVVPVAVEVLDKAEYLQDFIHPKNAVYVFGPEDGSIPKGYMNACHRFVTIDTLHCLNLSVAVAVVLYDRYLKEMKNGILH